jgi:hypothetical protein
MGVEVGAGRRRGGQDGTTELPLPFGLLEHDFSALRQIHSSLWFHLFIFLCALGGLKSDTVEPSPPDPQSLGQGRLVW